MDIFSRQGSRIFLELVEKADVLVENFRSGVLEKAGLDYQSLSKVNPGLIYCSISGYSPRGPNMERPGFDFAVQAETGLMSINGFAEHDPVKLGIAAHRSSGLGPMRRCVLMQPCFQENEAARAN